MAKISSGVHVSRHLWEQNEGHNSRLTHPTFHNKHPPPSLPYSLGDVSGGSWTRGTLPLHKPCSKYVLPAVRWETPKSSLPWYGRHYSLHRSLLRSHKIPLKTWVHLKLPLYPRVTTAKKQSPHIINRASMVAQMVTRLPAMLENWVWSPGKEDPLEKEMATHSCILAWKIPWTKEPSRLQSMGLQRVRHDWMTSLSFSFTSLTCSPAIQPSPTQSLSCPSLGLHLLCFRGGGESIYCVFPLPLPSTASPTHLWSRPAEAS